MKYDPEVYNFLIQHMDAIYANDTETYHASTSKDLTLYEWWVTPHRIDGLPFHDFMMTENARRGHVFGAEGEHDPRVKPPLRAMTLLIYISSDMAIQP